MENYQEKSVFTDKWIPAGLIEWKITKKNLCLLTNEHNIRTFLIFKTKFNFPNQQLAMEVGCGGLLFHTNKNIQSK